MIKAQWNGAVVAESDETIVVEGNHYFPADSVNSGYLRASATSSLCSWKGQAAYYSLEVGGQRNEDAAWFYPEPEAAAAHIAGRIAFWRGVTIDEIDEAQHRAEG
ncbi:DUF427 domain-containing protein [Sinomonas sp. JGH33]|uniref:DUF427 domain-containing protein n=1 Tax=Sinomonas terricola TaxID=3110330 RepID=A0ABU5T856_9MICC|nr:DUF427 domain-containing protein [Sinomonas sp. JGH33]MEA5455720.1 DUF427 domain-containing protein [Sinomonas sp. JGH33]